jgi:hypothetical protein
MASRRPLSEPGAAGGHRRQLASSDAKGLPLRYDLDAEGVPMVRGGQYLDLAAAAAGCAEVAAKA